MTNKRITELNELTILSNDDLLAIVDDPSGSPETKKITVANLIAGSFDNRYLKLDGSNANQNIDIGIYNFAADSFTGNTFYATGSFLLKPNNPSLSYFEFDVVDNNATITLHGGTETLYIEGVSHQGVGMLFYDDATHFFSIGSNWSGNSVFFTASQPLEMRVNADYDDYLIFTTVSDIPEIFVQGTNNVWINTSHATDTVLGLVKPDTDHWLRLEFSTEESEYSRIHSSHELRLEANQDYTNYLTLNIVSNIPTLSTSNSQDLHISADGTQIVFDRDVFIGTDFTGANRKWFFDVSNNTLFFGKEIGGFVSPYITYDTGVPYLAIFAGNAESGTNRPGNAYLMQAGFGDGTGDGGYVEINTGSAGSTDADGGELIFATGHGTGTGRAGDISFETAAAGNPGDIYFTSHNSGKMYFEAGTVEYTLTGEIIFRTSGDTNDYIDIITISDQPIIRWHGCDGKLTAENGLIEFDDENLKTLGNIGIGGNVGNERVNFYDNGMTGFSVIDIHTDNDDVWAMRIYNDTFSPTGNGIFAYYPWNSGKFSMGTEANTDLAFYTNTFNNERMIITNDGHVTIPHDDKVFRIGAGLDAEIYVSSDNLYIRNITQDQDIIFQVNDGGVTRSITYDASEPTFKIDGGSWVGSINNPLLRVTGTDTGSETAIVMRFDIVNNGTGGDYCCYGVGDLGNAAGGSVLGYYADLNAIQGSSGTHRKSAFIFDNVINGNSTGGTYFDTGIDLNLSNATAIPSSATGIDYTVVGLDINRGTFIVHDAGGGSWNDLTLYGIKISGWGSSDITSGVAGTFTNRAIYVDGGMSQFDGALDADGYHVNVVAKTANYTATLNDDMIVCDGTFTINLPTASSVIGKRYYVKNEGTGIITIDGNGSETIDGELTQEIEEYDGILIISDGSNWYID